MITKTVLSVAVAMAVLTSPAFAGGKKPWINNEANASSSSSSSSSSYAGNSNNQNIRFQDQKQAPGVAAASLAASGGCLGSSSIGGSGPGFGITVGSTWEDDRCNAREDARYLAAFGYKAQALQLLINNSPMIRQVMQPNAAPTSAAQPRYADSVAPRAVAVGSCKIPSRSGNGQCLD